jgi:hypothetical protein
MMKMVVMMMMMMRMRRTTRVDSPRFNFFRVLDSIAHRGKSFQVSLAARLCPQSEVEWAIFIVVGRVNLVIHQ